MAAFVVVTGSLWSILEAGLDFIAAAAASGGVDWWSACGSSRPGTSRAAMRKTALTPVDRAAASGWVSRLWLARCCCRGWRRADLSRPWKARRTRLRRGPAVADWRNYGGVPDGQRFAQLDQINVENVGQLKEAWRTRTGVAYDFKQTPQMANGLVLRLHRRQHADRAGCRHRREEVGIRHQDRRCPGGLERGSTFARTCRGLGYHEAPPTYTGECAKRIITGTADARLVAVDAMTGQLCRIVRLRWSGEPGIGPRLFAARQLHGDVDAADRGRQGGGGRLGDGQPADRQPVGRASRL